MVSTLFPIDGDSSTRWFSAHSCVVHEAERVSVYVGGSLIGAYEPGDRGTRNVILVGLPSVKAPTAVEIAAGPTISSAPTAIAMDKVDTTSPEPEPPEPEVVEATADTRSPSPAGGPRGSDEEGVGAEMFVAERSPTGGAVVQHVGTWLIIAAIGRLGVYAAADNLGGDRGKLESRQQLAQPQRVTLIPKRVAVRSRRLHHDDRLALGLLQRPQQTQERDGLAWVLELHELEHFPPNRRDRGNELRLRHVDRHNAAHRQQRQKRLHVELFDIYRGITTLAFHPG
jgi:hypothetical protein